MKNIFLILAFSFMFFSCKKEKVTTSSNTASSSENVAKIDSLVVYNIQSEMYALEPVNGLVYLKYSGGNGGKYPTQKINSTGLSGLVLTISEGVVNKNDSIIKATLTGTPSKAGKYSFKVTLGGKTTSFDWIIVNKLTSNNRMDYLCASPWKLASIEYYKDNVLQTFSNPVEECEKDDLITFYSNGTVKYKPGYVFCNDETSQQEELMYWQFDAYQENLLVKSENEKEYTAQRIIMLSNDILVIESIDDLTEKIKAVITYRH